MSDLIKYDAARFALQQAVEIDEVKDIRDKAQAMAAYAKQAKDTKLVEWATEIKVRAERKAGQMLAEMNKNEGGRPSENNRSHDATGFQKLSDLGINKTQSSRWQKLASVSDEQFEHAVAAAKEVAGEVTTAAMLRIERANNPKPAPQPTAPIAEPEAPAEQDQEFQDCDPTEDEVNASIKAEADQIEYIKKLLESDDPLAQALFDVKRYKEAARIAKERMDGLLNEKSELIRMIKSLQAKLKKAGIK